MHKSLLIFTIPTLVVLMMLAGCSSDSSTYDGKPQSKPADLKHSELSHKGIFKLTFYPEAMTSVPINQYHNWIIQLSNRDGEPVYPAAFAITGGMPAHGHGLSTQPKVTRYLGEGKYLVEGIKFTMDGQWVLQFQILSGDLQDTAEMVFNVDY